MELIIRNYVAVMIDAVFMVALYVNALDIKVDGGFSNCVWILLVKFKLVHEPFINIALSPKVVTCSEFREFVY